MNSIVKNVDSSADSSDSAGSAGRSGFAISLKGRALRLLSGREYSRAELVRKLAAFEEVPGELALALDDLEVKGFISDLRAAESLVRRRGCGSS